MKPLNWLYLEDIVANEQRQVISVEIALNLIHTAVMAISLVPGIF